MPNFIHVLFGLFMSARWLDQLQRGNVFFTSESRFCLDSNDGRVRVWRQQGRRYHDYVIAEHQRAVTSQGA